MGIIIETTWREGTWDVCEARGEGEDHSLLSTRLNISKQTYFSQTLSPSEPLSEIIHWRGSIEARATSLDRLPLRYGMTVHRTFCHESYHEGF